MSQANGDKRQSIKNRITAAQARHAAYEGESLAKALGDRAVAARDSVTTFARQHPVATVAGGLALGVLVSAMFKNSPTRRAGRYAGARAAGLAAIGSEMASALIAQVAESASNARHSGSGKLEEAGDAARGTARNVANLVVRAIKR